MTIGSHVENICHNTIFVSDGCVGLLEDCDFFRFNLDALNEISSMIELKANIGLFRHIFSFQMMTRFST